MPNDGQLFVPFYLTYTCCTPAWFLYISNNFYRDNNDKKRVRRSTEQDDPTTESIAYNLLITHTHTHTHLQTYYDIVIRRRDERRRDLTCPGKLLNSLMS